MKTLEESRARIARLKSDFFSGESDTHPFGETGRRWIIPPEGGKDMWDTHPRSHVSSEWGKRGGDSVMTRQGSNLSRILRDDDFLSVTNGIKERLTKKAMAQATTDEDRADAIAEYHALDRILAVMRSEAAKD